MLQDEEQEQKPAAELAVTPSAVLNETRLETFLLEGQSM